MTLDPCTETTVRRFFGRYHYAADLVLPSGGFGRPFDGYFQLTRLESGDGTVTLELSSRFVLTFSGEVTVQLGKDETTENITMSGFRALEVRWAEYVSERRRVARYLSGEVILTALRGCAV